MKRKDNMEGSAPAKKLKENETTRRGTWTEFVYENEKFEAYYKAQGIVEESEFTTFMGILKDRLPTTFRIANKSTSKHVIDRIKSLKWGTIEHEGKVIPPPQPLPWYPDSGAWVCNASKKTLKNCEGLKEFRSLLIELASKGSIVRQEAVSMLPPLCLDVKPGHRVLDMCAAPGSKTTQIINMLRNEDESKDLLGGAVVANDINKKRCNILDTQTAKQKTPLRVITAHNAALFPGRQVFDRVLADVPCSGDGTIRKNPDLWKKWTVKKGHDLHLLQKKILHRGIDLLKPSGRIVYSTCSLNPIEDESVVASTLAEFEGQIRLVDPTPYLKGLLYEKGLTSWKVPMKDKLFSKFEEVPDIAKQHYPASLFPPTKEMPELKHCIRVLPHKQNTGGFFVAIIEKLPSVAPIETKLRDTETPTHKAQGSFDFIPYSAGIDPIWLRIKKFYGIKDDFPNTQLLTSSAGKKKLYIMSKGTSDLITQLNINVFRVGICLFKRIDGSLQDNCDYRIEPSGLNVLYPFLTKRVVTITKKDAILLLTEKHPKFLQFDKETREQLENQTYGCCVFVLMLGDQRQLLSAWRGNESCNIILSKQDRPPLLAACQDN